MQAQPMLNTLHRAPQSTRAVPVPMPRAEHGCSQDRLLAAGSVRLFLFNSREELIEIAGSLMEQSISGATIRTPHPLRNGDRFLIIDRDGYEGEAQAAWVDERDDGSVVGARITWIGRVLAGDAEGAVN